MSRDVRGVVGVSEVVVISLRCLGGCCAEDGNRTSVVGSLGIMPLDKFAADSFDSVAVVSVPFISPGDVGEGEAPLVDASAEPELENSSAIFKRTRAG